MASPTEYRARGSDPAGAFTTRLIEAASRKVDDPALVHNSHGRWVRRRWRDVVAEIDGLAAGLAALGLRPAQAVAVQGELSPSALLLAAAVSAAGGSVIPVAGSQSATDLQTLLAGEPIALAVVQTRDALETWLDATDDGHGIPIVFDHATPERRSPDDRVVLRETLGRLAPARGWAEGLTGGGRGVASQGVWLEETLADAAQLDQIVEAWIQGGLVPTFPERLASAPRDRAAIAPERWIASAAALDGAAEAIFARLPETGPTSRIIARLLAGGRSPAGLFLRAVLRSRLGIGSLFEIELLAGTPAPRTRALFDGLGVGIVDFVPKTPLGPLPERPFSDFTLSPGYSL